MDLSFPRFDRHLEVTSLPGDLAVLMAGVAARQAATPTAHVQARVGHYRAAMILLAPLDGAFNGPMATALIRWKDE